MALPSWASDSITVIRPSTTTSRGSTIFDYDNPTSSTSVSGCSVQPASTSLDIDGRVLGLTDGLTAYIPPSTDVVAGDMIVYNSEKYLINGEPRSWSSPTGAASSIILNLVRYSG